MQRFMTYDILTTVLDFLRDGTFGECHSQSEAYRTACHKMFPLATAFMSPSSDQDSCFAPMNHMAINHEVLTNEI
uniref:Uncharacterized protein n=1 Tax=Laticauda laticaudata TaxID=8630 RepID=A0A8C5SWL3_LATLA